MKVDNHTERIFGHNDPAGVVATTADGKTFATVDQSKSSVKIEFDFKKLDTAPEAPSEKVLVEHEIGHGVDMAQNPVNALNQTQGESESTAEDFQKQVSGEKRDMSEVDAQKAVLDMLDTEERIRQDCLKSGTCTPPPSPK